MSMTESSVERVRLLNEIVQFLQKPRDVEELADEFGRHPQTMRRFLWELRDAGRVRELSRKNARRKLWQATAEQSATGVAMLPLSIGHTPLTALVVGELAKEEPEPAFQRQLAGALCYLWRRSRWREDPDLIHRMGALTPSDLQGEIMELHRRIGVHLEILEQLIFNFPALWEEGPKAATLIGLREERATDAEELASWYTHWLATRSRQ